MICEFLSLSIALAGAARHTELTIDNFQPADVVSYPVVIVNGSADGPEMAIGTSWNTAIRFPVVNHRYTAVVELKPGINMVLLHSGISTMKFRLDYIPPRTRYKVYAVYLTASDAGDTYYTTDKKDRFPIRQKFDVALKLLQAFTADAMNRAGYGRKTFSLELDHDGKVITHFIKSPKKADELRSLDGNGIYSHAYDTIKIQFQESNSKWCCITGFTNFDPLTKKTSGHLALGGGAQGCFGSGSMQWWPESLKDVPKVFANTTFVDPDKTFEDSAFRKTVWANVSTAFGAMLHEMGHTFGLPHSPDPFSVMSRGFDHFNRSFCAIEPPVAGKTDPVTFTQDQLTRWDPFFAARLNYSPWFQPYELTTIENIPGPIPPTITFEGDDVVIESTEGIRVAGAQNDGIPSWFVEYKSGDPPKKLKLSRKDLRSKLKDTKEDFQIVVVDDRGQQTQIDDKLPAGGS